MNPFRSSRPSSLPVRDPIDDPTDNCCHNCMHISVTLIHLVEFIFGLALMGYSIAISTHKPDPQRGFAITLQAWASLFIASSVLGTLGLTKNYCRRIPLTISAYIGLVQTVIAFVFFLIIYLERDSLLNYFNDKHQQLYLSTGFITFFDKNIGVIYGFLFLLIAAGFARSVVMSETSVLLSFFLSLRLSTTDFRSYTTTPSPWCIFSDFHSSIQ